VPLELYYSRKPKGLNLCFSEVNCTTKCKMTKSSSQEDTEWLLQQYIRVGKMIYTMFSPLVDVVIHDYRKPNRGIKVIFGGSLTGRQKGDPLTELGIRRLRGKLISDNLLGYSSITASGNKMKSSSIAIRDTHGALVGSLCVNFSVTFLEEAQEVFRVLTSCQGDAQQIHERYRSRARGDEVADALRLALRRIGIQARHLKTPQRKVIVQELAQQGLVSQRGAVTTIARELGITRPTVYRYLR
jgi:predicted transcriptional regulator YheO